MIKVIEVANSDDKLRFFEDFSGKDEVWLVPDLRSKIHLQRKLIDRYGFTPENSVLRANEYWQKQLAKLAPNINQVSTDFTKAFIHSQLQKMEGAWLHRPGAAETAYRYLENFMPILAHQDGYETVRQWIKENEACEWKWGHWFELSQKLWQLFNERGLVVANWLSAILLGNIDELKVLDHRLVVDLGVHVTSTEIEVLKRLGEFGDVTFLVASPEWKDQFEPYLQVYQPILEKAEQKDRIDLKSEAIEQKKTDYLKFTTMISEVKHVTAQTRKWADQCDNLRDIVITAPNIEVYWPSLREHLRAEGIPIAKASVTRAHSLPSVMRWLSRLRNEIGKVTYADLQSQFYNEHEKLDLPFAEFARVYQMIHGDEDIHRNAKVAGVFQRKLKADQEISFNDFLNWSLKYWPPQFIDDEQIRPLTVLAQTMFRDGSVRIDLKVEDWIAYLEAMACKTEIETEPADKMGVQIVELHSADYVQCRFLCVMGLTDSGLRPAKRNGLNQSDVAQLYQNTGFQIYSSDHQMLEFDCMWLVQQKLDHFLATFPATDFAGAAQAPSLYWLREKLQKGEDYEAVVFPDPCRWDEWQESIESNSGDHQDWVKDQKEIFRQIQIDQGEIEQPPLSGAVIPKLSATAIEQYLACPFKFAAARLYRLMDLPDLDIDIDHMTRGQLMHSIFEVLVKEKVSYEASDEQLQEIVEQCRLACKIELGEKRMWQSLMVKHVRLAKRFLQFEKSWQERFPNSQVEGTEVKVFGKLNSQTGELTSSTESEGIPFSGSIDRVDSDGSGNAIIIDYKSSKSQAKNHATWVSGLKIQLAMYAQAVENGLTQLNADEVVSAVYYVAKNCDRDAGYKLEDFDGELYDLGRGRAKLNRESKAKLFADINSMIANSVKDMQLGEFKAVPHENTNCDQCRWRTVCRASHLN